MATINSKIEGVDVLGVVTAGETIYVGRATSTQHGIVKPAATDFEFDNQTNAMLIKLGVGLKRTDDGIAVAIYDGNVVTDVLAIEDGLEIKYANIDEETENSKIIPWSEFTSDHAGEIRYNANSSNDTVVLQSGAKGNVKSFFGNQSIYGSGNIDLYSHNVWLRAFSDTRIIGDCIFNVICLSNTAIDSLTDLFSVLKPIVGSDSTYPISGHMYNTHNNKYYVATRVYPASDGGILANTPDEERWFKWPELGTLTFYDKVKPV